MPSTIPSLDFYTLLQISRDASQDDIKAAYRRTLLRLHPDKQRLSRHWHPTRAGNTGTSGVVDPNRSPHSASSDGETPLADMALLREAYETLSDVRLRAAYDAHADPTSLGDGRGQVGVGGVRSSWYGPMRPAQVVSLEEFVAVEVEDGAKVEAGSGTGTEAGMDADRNAVRHWEWRDRCRCGGAYRITEDELENETHLVGCESCSEVIWVGYEVVVTEDEGEC